jgi:hypothetical protein
MDERFEGLRVKLRAAVVLAPCAIVQHTTCLNISCYVWVDIISESNFLADYLPPLINQAVVWGVSSL